MSELSRDDFSQLFLAAIDEQIQKSKARAAGYRNDLEKAKRKFARAFVLREAMQPVENDEYDVYHDLLVMVRSNLRSAQEELQSAETELERLQAFQYDLTQDPGKLQSCVEAMAAEVEATADDELDPFTPFDLDSDVPF
ncbi:MAG: hypothetical protein AB1791_00665 [Chloroflexota bacterium]